VLLTEMMGQAAAKALDSERRARGKAMLAKIASASFRQWVRPGDEVMLHGEITTNTDRYANADCRAEVNGKPVAQASLFFTFIPANAFMGDLRDAVLEEFLAKSAT
jgi:3-hydroxymyristoyl/3-hydroxydecanoyl-(acyl carrier protein) dehydratase